MSHTVTVERRSNGSFAPILSGEAVKPEEAIRLLATGVNQQLFHTPEFIITDNLGNQVFRRNAGASPQGDAWIDTQAPLREGEYVFLVIAQSYPFLPFTHQASTIFKVDTNAPPPPSAPPEKGLLPGLGDVKGIVIALAVLVGLVAVGGALKK